MSRDIEMGASSQSFPTLETRIPRGDPNTKLNNVMEHCLKTLVLPTSYGYQKLSFFSGKTPVLSVEEDFSDLDGSSLTSLKRV